MTSLVLAALLLGGAPEVKGGIRWERDFELALKKARGSGKPVMIDFWADWCGWCHRLDETTYRDPKVVQLSKSFVPLKLNAEGTRAEVSIAVRYGVSSLPTIAFISPSGRLIDRVSGFQGPGPFPRTLETVKAKATKVIAWENALEKDSQDAAALFQLGMHMFEQESYEESRDLLRKAAEVDTRRPVADRKQARMLIGIIERYDAKYQRAEAVLKEGLALEPATEFDPKMLYVLGRVYAAWNKTAEARVILNRVLNEYPASSVAQKARETLVALGH